MNHHPQSRGPTPEERFRAVHADTYLDLFKFVERRISGSSEAEDIVSTVFLTAWRRAADMPADARPWLFGIARMTMANELRGGHRRRALDVSIAAEAEIVAQDSVDAKGARLDFIRAWQSLEPQERETLALVAFDGLTADQAAEVVGCRRSTFTMRLTRARRRLRAALDGDHHTTRNSRTLTTAEKRWTAA